MQLHFRKTRFHRPAIRNVQVVPIAPTTRLPKNENKLNHSVTLPLAFFEK
jgi:hypothetical protein